MSSLSGKVAVVTGASRGIGAAIARRLAADGANVVVNYARSSDAAEKLARHIGGSGKKAIAVQADVSKPDQVQRLFDAAVKNFGHVDIVVNNAGTAPGTPVDKITPEHFNEVFHLNVLGTIQMTVESLRHFPKTGGRIINLSSILATGTTLELSVYGASKAAVEALTRYWAQELGPRNITVNAVAPGLTETDMTSGITEEVKKMIASRTPLGRVGKPEEIADVVAFLASDDARWVTGHTLTASGGLRS